MSERILVVDDEPALRRTLERALKSLHFQVVSASDPHMAYSLLDQVDIDLVLLDLHLPQLSGDHCSSRWCAAGLVSAGASSS